MLDSLAKNWMTGLGSLETPTTVPTTPAEPEPEPAPEPTPAPAPVKPEPAPAKPEPAAPAESAEEKWPRTAQDWKKYKQASKEREEAIAKERDELKSRYELTAKEIAELRKAPPTTDVEPLKKELSKYQEELRTVAVERDPRFKAYFNAKTEAQFDIAKRTVGPEKANRMVELLGMAESPYRDREIEELIRDLPTMKQGQIGSVINSLGQIQYERESEITKARANYEAIQAQQKSGHEAAMAKQKSDHERAFNSILEKHQNAEDGTVFYQMRDGQKDWNDGVQKRIENAKNLLFGNAPTEQIMEAALWSTVVPDVLKYATERDAEVAKLRDQITKLTAANPSLEGGKAAGGGDGTKEPLAKNASPHDAIHSWVKGIKSAMSQQ